LYIAQRISESRSRDPRLDTNRAIVMELIQNLAILEHIKKSIK
jgi:hypothetical protein